MDDNYVYKLILRYWDGAMRSLPYTLTSWGQVVSQCEYYTKQESGVIGFIIVRARLVITLHAVGGRILDGKSLEEAIQGHGDDAAIMQTSQATPPSFSEVLRYGMGFKVERAQGTANPNPKLLDLLLGRTPPTPQRATEQAPYEPSDRERQRWANYKWAVERELYSEAVDGSMELTPLPKSE